ncbi:MAG: hypothetical protein LBI20_03705 [Holosporales bacterium]|nr:hypothetical protein [Holosporales bacterium]
MKHLCRITFFLVAFCVTVAHSETTEFSAKLTEFSNLAKGFSKKNITPEDVETLLAAFKSILEAMKQKYILDKSQVTSFIFRYPNQKEFPDLSEHNIQNKYDEQIIKFTIATYLVFINLDDDILRKIIAKSPLELVSLLQEFDVLLQFVSADPKEFGHGVFSEKNGNQLVVFATTEAILRIMRVIVIKELLAQGGVYKLSRTTTAVLKDFQNKKPADILNDVSETMKRNTADDSRIAIFFPEKP